MHHHLLIISSVSSPLLSASLAHHQLFTMLLLFFFFLILLLLHCRRRRHSNDHRRLPPGSMGWPYIGETLKLYTENPNSFFFNRQKRYGDIFKTHILGCPCVMISSPEAAKIVLVTKAHLFKPTYPISKEKMIGPEALFFQQDCFIFSALLEKSVHHQYFARNEKDQLEMEGIEHLYSCLENGYNSMPLDLPGTPFYKAMKARKQLNVRLKKLIEKRRQSGKQGGGLLGVLLDEKNNKLNDSQICDNIIGVIFAAHDTTASVLTWLLKYLHDNQDLLQAVTHEQEEIRQEIIEANRRLTWDDTKRMPLTTRVIQETLRAASILSFTFREAVEDVEFEGYLIPRGWKVLPLFRTIHHSADYFPQPQKFDPSRFQVPPRPNTYMPFGNGVHSCPGSELAKLEMLILIHHLTLTYRWQIVEEEDGIQYGPFPVPKRGLPIRVTHRPRSSKLLA
ncbi:abscisic acid 8'-hydroxylase 2 isoform X3 [Mercurialis annua]|uniref:abscisic acid 8'-hydroxylase 2 isoform X3 n=1 Tax=Mercurialis annua TaxID=3986 RepID=UPI0024ADC792|nr:abscisic acid 8'-hydroxylase 2 isoform X3 [Mercurialis annua]